MTTEAGSETEVKEKPEESPAEPDQSEKPLEETQEVANAKDEEAIEKVKEKDGKEGKGISRFLPTWLKKQKSQSQTSPTKEVPPTEEEDSKVTQEKQEPAPEVNGHAEEEEETEEVKTEQVKEQEAESHSNASADTEPAKEERAEESTEKSPEDSKEATEGEKAEKEDKQVEAERQAEEGQTSIFQSPLRLVRKNKMKLVVCHVTLLDGTEFTCEVEKRAKGQYLFFKVCEHLNLLEKDYFGLSYTDSHEQKCWLDPTKEIKRQIRSNNWQFGFSVKFYPPDPSLLTEDITRYLLCLQLREDVASGRLPCSFVTHALLSSYTLQAEFGDHEPDQARPLDFISQLNIAPSQNKEMEEKILELHKSHKGMTPAQADTQFLENAKKLSMYGVDLHHAKDSEGVDIMLGVCANGLLVYKDRLRVNRFAWPKILKISYKRNNFYIKIRPGETEQFESTVGFKLQNHRSAKRLWKVCVENHSFFRLSAPEPPTKARFLTLGSKFRYSGRTQSQTRMASSLIDRPAPNFERTSSKRISRSLDGAPMISITDASNENGREPHMELHSDSKGSVPPTETTTADNTIPDTKEPEKTTEVEIEETIVIQEVSRASKPGPVLVAAVLPAEPPAEGESRECRVRSEEKVAVVEEAQPKRQESISSESESDEEAEYHPNVTVSFCHTQIPEEKEEDEEEEQEKIEKDMRKEEDSSVPDSSEQTKAEEQPREAEPKAERKTSEGVCQADDSVSDPMMTPDKALNGHALPDEAVVTPAEKEEEPKVNGEASVVEAQLCPQVICCSEPPVVKTEMVTISDTFAAQKTEIATKEVPIVHTETKTITYEAAELDGNSDKEPGVLMTAQTITSESLCTTTTTHITKTLKGGLSETRIEKRIVITGDCDIDHDQALAQAIKEAKEQHPDMSVTRVVVHKETELAEEEED
ncbi:band 4.1-like protein 2 isoform X7 [Gouania willdenowi]|uniref:band 4.1-like protein 2 isoform X7 n=1 Tax=Gouania willdenowi TaxID=441366 RepID=UPI001055D8F6|nr:band 4.1-like protein 2 isoform X7 [Gouania willdenowi]